MKRIRFEHNLFSCVAVGAFDARPIRDHREAQQAAKAMMKSRDLEWSRNKLDADRVEASLVRAILGQQIVISRLDIPPRRLDAPKVTFLSDLIVDEPGTQPLRPQVTSPPPGEKSPRPI